MRIAVSPTACASASCSSWPRTVASMPSAVVSSGSARSRNRACARNAHAAWCNSSDTPPGAVEPAASAGKRGCGRQSSAGRASNRARVNDGAAHSLRCAAIERPRIGGDAAKQRTRQQLGVALGLRMAHDDLRCAATQAIEHEARRAAADLGRCTGYAATKLPAPRQERIRCGRWRPPRGIETGDPERVETHPGARLGVDHGQRGGRVLGLELCFVRERAQQLRGTLQRNSARDDVAGAEFAQQLEPALARLVLDAVERCGGPTERHQQPGELQGPLAWRCRVRPIAC